MREETTIEVKNYIQKVFPELEPVKFNDDGVEYLINVSYSNEKNEFSMVRIFKDKVQIGEGFVIEDNMLKPVEFAWFSTPIYINDEDLPKIKQLIDKMKKQYMEFKIYIKKQEIDEDFKKNENKKLQNSV